MKNPFKLSIVFGALFLLSWSKLSYADWGGEQHAGHHGAHPYFHYHDRPHYGLHVADFYPDEYFPVLVAGTGYYYDDGVYYNYVGGDYTVVAPPMGAVVGAIPSDFKPVVLNGVTYYTDNGVYYVNTSSGYKVVLPPAVQTVPSTAFTQNTITVNVPSDRGGYIIVTLRRSGNGFVGPQGEFYPTFPNVSHLQTIYGR